MSTVLTILAVWVAVSLVVATGWIVVARYVHRRRVDQERAVREWRRRLRALKHPRLPRQRDHRRNRGA